ncbi:MAG: hypothetical protein AABZ55_03980, partial [Bdellovibrionota bacterium]
VKAIMTVIEKGSDREIYNVCGDEDISVNQTIKVAENLAARAFIQFQNDNARIGEIQKQNISNAKLKKLGWKPEVSYAEGMKKTWEWFKQQIDDAAFDKKYERHP